MIIQNYYLNLTIIFYLNKFINIDESHYKHLLILTKSSGGVRLHITKVFWYAVAICVVIVLWGSIAPDQLNNMTMTITVFIDRKSTRLNSSHVAISYAVFCLQKNTVRTG